MKNRLFAVTLFLTTTSLLWAQTAAPVNPAAQPQKSAQASPLDAKINRLLNRMTLEEKIGQMTQYAPWKSTEDKIKGETAQGGVGSLLNVYGAKNANEYQKIAVEQTRLHIPLLFGLDVIHGYKTIFPIPLAEDCAWNPELLEKCAGVAAQEAAAAGVRWTFAPMVDVSREPRWGRISEGSGEDPTLGSILAVARVHGFQGQHLNDPGSIAACAKHFVGYGAPVAGREYNTTDMSEVTLREVHLPPFKAAVEAGVETLMSAFNDLNGVPASGNKHTLRDILKGEWGFKGFVVSDWASVQQLVTHGFAADEKEAAQKGVQAGVDMDMQSHVYGDHVAELVKEKKISIQQVNDAVRRILRVKYDLGLFDNPYADESKEADLTLTQASLDLALQEAEQSIVLLKNERNLLPLSKNLKTIAVIGPLAGSKLDPLGSWHCRGEDALEKVTTVLDGIKSKLSPDSKVLYVEGVGTTMDAMTDKALAEAVDTVKKAQVAIVVAGETQDMSGEAAARTSLDLPGRQEQMLKALQATGVPVVLVLMNGRPLTIPWEAEHLPAIVESWFLGTQQGNALANVLFGDTNPSGKLVVTFPRNLGQVPIYYAQKNTGRPDIGKEKWESKYIDSPNSPLFPFGFGLSYTQFDYSNLALSDKTLGPSGELKVTAMVKNTGAVKGTEIVQLYIQDIAAAITQPVRKLMDFKRLTLDPGETQLVEFDLPASKLGYYNELGKYVVEPGKFNVWVAKDSSDSTLTDSFELTEMLKASR
ncbi:MAG TPA: beta-glucosidase BglX [bacterium]|jgi:beta-glucosidase|nr:beta-glucosidase BglX [bacterium]